MGRIATPLAELSGVSGGGRVLTPAAGSAGPPISWPATTLPGPAIDLTGGICDTARWLNELPGLVDLIYGPAGGCHRPALRRRHLPGGHQPACADERRRQGPPVRRRPPGCSSPAAGSPSGTSRRARQENSAVRCPGRTGRSSPPRLPRPAAPAIESAGFTVEHWNDLTRRPPADRVLLSARWPAGLHAFMTTLPPGPRTSPRPCPAGRLRIIQGVALAVGLTGPVACIPAAVQRRTRTVRAGWLCARGRAGTAGCRPCAGPEPSRGLSSR